jgi:hypothetical protein
VSVDWSEIEGKRLGLILVASDPEEGGGVLSGPVVRSESAFAVGRTSGPPFPLLPEWAARVRKLDDVQDADVRAIIGDVDYFTMLSVGDLEGEAEGLLPTGLNWNDFVGDDAE